MAETSRTDVRTEILAWLCGQCREILQLDAVVPGDNLFDIGGDSLAIIELMAAIEHRWGVELPIDRLLDASDLAEVASSIATRLEAGSGN